MYDGNQESLPIILYNNMASSSEKADVRLAFPQGSQQPFPFLIFSRLLRLRSVGIEAFVVVFPPLVLSLRTLSAGSNLPRHGSIISLSWHALPRRLGSIGGPWEFVDV